MQACEKCGGHLQGPPRSYEVTIKCHGCGGAGREKCYGCFGNSMVEERPGIWMICDEDSCINGYRDHPLCNGKGRVTVRLPCPEPTHLPARPCGEM